MSKGPKKLSQYLEKSFKYLEIPRIFVFKNKPILNAFSQILPSGSWEVRQRLSTLVLWISSIFQNNMDANIQVGNVWTGLFLASAEWYN